MEPHPQTNQVDSGRPKPGYVALLAGTAVVILAAGALLRPKQLAVESPIPLSETAPLQALSRRGELRDLAGYLSDRVAAVGRHVVYLADRRASGVAWAGPDSVVTTGGADSPVDAVRWTRDTAALPAVRAPPGPVRRGWLLMVARRPDGTLVSAVGISGGQTEVRCGEQVYRELTLATPLAAAFEGGGLFDLEGILVGIVGRCGERLVALSANDIGRALTVGTSPEARLLRALGLRAAPLDEPARSYFAVDSGVLVTEIVLRSPADDAGLRPGDVLVAVDTHPVRAPQDVADLVSSELAIGRTLALVRNGRPDTVALGHRSLAQDTLLGLRLIPEFGGIPVATVAPGSRAERAGLRTGDGILQIGELQPDTPLEARRALENAGHRPLFLVFRREGSDRGVWLR